MRAGQRRAWAAGGVARLNVTPSGRVLPCHAAESIPGLEFWSVRDRPLAEIWRSSPAFQAFRGTEWMAEPCRSCDMREIDYGGCRCQAMAIAGDAAATDPACELSPHHALIQALAAAGLIGGERDVCLPRARRAREAYCHSSSLNAVVALRAL